MLLFARVDPLGVAWLRIVSAAAVFAAWRRPWRGLSTLGGEGARTLLALGAVLAVMNGCFYTAIDHLPLGTVAAIEFLPVIALAALGSRTRRNAFALLLAVAGVYVCDQLAMARMARATYALLVSLLPATATIVGVVVLAQLPTRLEVVGVALVVAGVAVHSE